MGSQEDIGGFVLFSSLCFGRGETYGDGLGSREFSGFGFVLFFIFQRDLNALKCQLEGSS